jgi:hypothetical protein
MAVQVNFFAALKVVAALDAAYRREQARKKHEIRKSSDDDGYGILLFRSTLFSLGYPASGVKHFDERRERPFKQMLTIEEEHRIIETAPPYLRVGIVLLVQTGGRTYSEGFSVRKDQVDPQNGVIYPSGGLRPKGRLSPYPSANWPR